MGQPPEVVQPGLEHGGAEEEDEYFYANELYISVSDLIDLKDRERRDEESLRIERLTYRSQYQTRQHRPPRHREILNILPTVFLVPSSQRLTGNPRLNRSNILRVIENPSQLAILSPEHDEERY